MTPSQMASPELAGVEVHGISRASFILRGALAAGATYGATAVGPYVSGALGQTSGGDADILNFALTLEYLEANFYQVKGRTVSLSGEAKTLAQEFGAQESQHVSALTSAIKGAGGVPAKMPTFVFPVNDAAGFLNLAYTLENTGVGAYNGAAPSLQDKQHLAAAGSIVQVEGRHAAAIALLQGKTALPSGAFDKALTQSQVMAMVKPFIK